MPARDVLSDQALVIKHRQALPRRSTVYLFRKLRKSELLQHQPLPLDSPNIPRTFTVLYPDPTIADQARQTAHYTELLQGRHHEQMKRTGGSG